MISLQKNWKPLLGLPHRQTAEKSIAAPIVHERPPHKLLANFLDCCHHNCAIVVDEDTESHARLRPVLYSYRDLLEIHLAAISFDGVALSPGICLAAGHIVGVSCKVR